MTFEIVPFTMRGKFFEWRSLVDLAVNEGRLSLNSLAEAEVHGCAGTQSKRRWGKEYRQGVLDLSDFPNIEYFANTGS